VLALSICQASSCEHRRSLAKHGRQSRFLPRYAKITAMTVQPGARTRPFTGREYLESLRDDREIWIYGQRVKDVTTHPAFRNTARMIARLYDALHDPARQAILTTATDTG